MKNARTDKSDRIAGDEKKHIFRGIGSGDVRYL